MLPRRPRTWTPKAIPFGLLILLLGLWAVFAPLARDALPRPSARPGGLTLLFTGVASGLFMRRTIVEQAPPSPLETSQVTVPE